MGLSEVYSSVYWLAARHRWMDMAELAVTRQRWAVEQKTNPWAWPLPPGTGQGPT